MNGWKWQSLTLTSLGIIQLLNPSETTGELARADLPVQVSTEIRDLAVFWKHILLIADLGFEACFESHLCFKQDGES